MDRAEKAEALFLEGYNCSQSVALAFRDLVPVSKEHLAMLSAPFGGGMSRLREVCGAVSGMSIILGLLYGYDGPETGEKKAELYSLVQELSLSFEREHGSIVCRDLLGLGPGHSSPIPSQRNRTFYCARPCAGLIRSAASTLQRYINEHPVEYH